MDVKSGNDAVRKRVTLIDGKFDLPKEVGAKMNEIRKAIAGAAALVAAVVQSAAKHDVGRLIAALDDMQKAKDTACVALIMPYADVDTSAEASKDKAV